MKPSLKEINEYTELNVELSKTIKESKRVSGLVFNISLKPGEERVVSLHQLDDMEITPEITNAFLMLEERLGERNSKVIQLIKNYPVRQIVENIQYVDDIKQRREMEGGEPITGGYYVNAVKKDYADSMLQRAPSTKPVMPTQSHKKAESSQKEILHKIIEEHEDEAIMDSLSQLFNDPDFKNKSQTMRWPKLTEERYLVFLQTQKADVKIPVAMRAEVRNHLVHALF
nr:hypothetical protein [Methylomarinum sp. Ch1-1]MDP4523226.1 hypothetical protein [Methylomarinum sp. Ch1-1]